MDINRLDLILARFPDRTILVVGDFALDKELLLDDAPAETAPELAQVRQVRLQLGGAGGVAANLRALGLHVIALGVVGDDGEGFELLRGLDQLGVDVDALVIRTDRCTPARIIPLRAGAPAVGQLEIANRTPLPAAAEELVIRALRGVLPRVHGVVIADRAAADDCGVITERVRDELSGLAQLYPATPFVADSGTRSGLFRDVLLKLSARAAVQAAGLAPAEPDPLADRALSEAAGAELYRRVGQPVFVALGAAGMLVWHLDGPTHVPPAAGNAPTDTAGAEDAALAGIAAALCAGATVAEAAAIGNLAAAVAVSGPASRRQMIQRLLGQS